ncbi:MAG: hypothetical protein IBX43_05070 [Campylobacterales bacterium]|nr:hypothetical protein [Campylobacterales bacterium]
MQIREILAGAIGALAVMIGRDLAVFGRELLIGRLVLLPVKYSLNVGKSGKKVLIYLFKYILFKFGGHSLKNRWCFKVRSAFEGETA